MIVSGARIRYISNSLSPNLKKHVESGQITYLSEKYNDKHLDDVWLVICGSDDAELKKKVDQATTDRHIFCNFVDEPLPSSFISPSVISKGDITIAISTNGKSPALNRFLKMKISNFIGEEYEQFVELMGNIRPIVLDNITGQQKRAELFDSIVQNPKILELIKNKKITEAEKFIKDIVSKEIKDQKL